MGRPLKTLKYNQGVNVDGSTTSVYVGYGYPTNGEPNNSWDTDQPGIIGGWPGKMKQLRSLQYFYNK
jgi:hypothetical protein